MVAALIILFSTSSVAQIGAIVLGGIVGLWLCRGGAQAPSGHVEMPVSRTAGLVTLAGFLLLLVGLPVLRGLTGSSGVALFDAFYRSGALIFGGGHVVLPLLREAFVAPGWLSDDAFLAGYGAAQAVPGPLFTFAAYLGWWSVRSRTESRGRFWASSASFCPGSWCCSELCRSGTPSEGAPALRR